MHWWLLLILEVAAGINAGLVFRLFDRGLAGVVGGTVFTLLALLAVYVVQKNAGRFRTIGMVLSILFLVLSVLLWTTRLLLPLEQPVTHVLGIPLSLYHPASTSTFFLLVIFTVVQIVLQWRTRKA